MVYVIKQSVLFCQSIYCYFCHDFNKIDNTRAQIVFTISLHYHMAMKLLCTSILREKATSLPYICDVAMTVIT